MTSSAEQRLNDRGLSLDDETGFGREDEPDVSGYLVLRPNDDGAEVIALVRPGIEAWQREMFAEWVEQRMDRFFEHGPEPDGWQKRKSDNGWQLWARMVDLPPLD
ncbi:hypothetical protein [Plantactinospora sp. WMMB782]|uniref:hypothetical protein n=1 Tax=Plantactinospora sp. WMMB782 TaxID=3404121 RepID=UPI003B957E31